MKPLAFLPHTLLWVEDIIPAGDGSLPIDLHGKIASKFWPEWHHQHDQSRPVVVRRAIHSDLIPVGIRGQNRSERLAAWVSPSSIISSLRPDEVVQQASWTSQYQSHPLAQFLAMDQINSIFASHQIQWGIGGSVGFELATGISTANKNSDLDLIAYLPEQCDDYTLCALWSELNELGVQMDVQIETLNGAFALREWVNRIKGPVMLKTPVAAVLTNDPWSTL